MRLYVVFAIICGMCATGSYAAPPSYSNVRVQKASKLQTPTVASDMPAALLQNPSLADAPPIPDSTFQRPFDNLKSARQSDETEYTGARKVPRSADLTEGEQQLKEPLGEGDDLDKSSSFNVGFYGGYPGGWGGGYPGGWGGGWGGYGGYGGYGGWGGGWGGGFGGYGGGWGGGFGGPFWG